MTAEYTNNAIGDFIPPSINRYLDAGNSRNINKWIVNFSIPFPGIRTGQSAKKAAIASARLALLIPIAAVLLSSAAATISIQLADSAFKVTGWPAPATPPSRGWASIFAVYAGAGDVPLLLGSYRVEAGVLAFHPQFPLAPGVHYRAVFHPPGAAAIEQTFDGPAADTRRLTRVDRVYPSADVLPSNLLRWYIYFSAPMSQGEAGRRLHLLDENGKPLAGVFLPGEELWDPRFQRLTMTLDPGRIKRGLTSNQAMGPPIADGHRYTLAIDRDWPDARNVPMIEGFRKTFRGGPPERSKPDPKQWRLIPPKAGALNGLTVIFPVPMNYVLLQRMLRVSKGDGNIAGQVTVDRQETRWLFTPRQAWAAGDYRLIIDTALEDLAGNSIAVAFDIDVFEQVHERITASAVALPFSVR